MPAPESSQVTPPATRSASGWIFHTCLLGGALLGAALAVLAAVLLDAAGLLSDPTWGLVISGAVGLAGTGIGTSVGGHFGIEWEDQAERRRHGLPPHEAAA